MKDEFCYNLDNYFVISCNAISMPGEHCIFNLFAVGDDFI